MSQRSCHLLTCLAIVLSFQFRSSRTRLFLAATLLAICVWGSLSDNPSLRMCIKVWPTISRALRLPRRRRFEEAVIFLAEKLTGGLLARLAGIPALPHLLSRHFSNP